MRKYLLILMFSVFALSASAQSQQEWRDSIARLSRMIELHPRNVELRLRKAAINIELEQWKYALDEYSNVLDIEPTNIAALYYRAFVNQHLARYDFARVDYEAVLKMAPLDKLSLMGLVLTNIADNHNTEAYDGANRLVIMFPDDASVYGVRSEVEEKLGMLDAALDDIAKAISIEDAKMTESGKTRITHDDDIVTYQLTAFSLNMRLGKKSQAKEHLDYLVHHGIAKAQLSDYFLQVSK